MIRSGSGKAAATLREDSWLTRRCRLRRCWMSWLPWTRRCRVMAAVLRTVAETFAEVPDLQHTAHRLRLVAH